MEKKHLMKYLSKINNGRFFKASWSSEVPVKKEFENRYVVSKVTISTVRKGIQYTNTKAYKDKLMKRMSIDCAGNDSESFVDSAGCTPGDFPDSLDPQKDLVGSKRKTVPM